MNKKEYMKPAMRVVMLQHQQHILTVSNSNVQSLRGGYFNYGGSDEDYDEGAR